MAEDRASTRAEKDGDGGTRAGEAAVGAARGGRRRPSARSAAAATRSGGGGDGPSPRTGGAQSAAAGEAQRAGTREAQAARAGKGRSASTVGAKPAGAGKASARTPVQTIAAPQVDAALAEEAATLLRLALEGRRGSRSRELPAEARTSLERVSKLLDGDDALARLLSPALAGLPLGLELELGRHLGPAEVRARVAANLPRLRAVIDEATQVPAPPRSRAQRRATKPPRQRARRPAPPTNVVAVGRNASAAVSWTPTAERVQHYVVTPTTITGQTLGETTVPGTASFVLVTGLTNGVTYTFTVRGVTQRLRGPESLPSNPVTPSLLPASPFEPVVPALSVDPVLIADPALTPATTLLTDATRIGSKWRFEYLKAQAVRAAQETLEYEQHLATLMQMTVAKVGSAEQLLNATMIEAVRRIDEISRELASLTSDAALAELVDPLSQVASEALLLPSFLLWLARTSPIRFWIGLFEAVISDLASVFLGDTDFSRTKAFLADAFSSDLDGIRDAVVGAVQDVLDRLDAEVDQMVAPVRAAVAQVAAGTRRATAAIFEAFDMPLLMNASATGGPDIPNVDPLGARVSQLEAQVDKIAADLKSKISTLLQPLLDVTSAGDLFVALAMGYLVLPILGFLAISLAGGPFSAALLAAVVLIAVQELVRLLLGWLTGPLLAKIDEVRRVAEALVARLQGLLSDRAQLVRNLSPELVLEILSNQLRELKDLIPREFVEAAAAIVQEARNVVLRTGVDLALAAEQAVGTEHATAFEVIGRDYGSDIPAAPQLPGGSDPWLLAGARLLRDIGRLEQQRTSILDGKEVEFPLRLSLFRLLGGDPLNPAATAGEFSRFLTTREVVLRLDESQLVDARYPGVYRVLIKDIRATGVFNAPPLGPLTGGIPLTLTHLGTSRTRVKRGSNPFAPPLALPDCVDMNELQFTSAAIDQAALEAAVRDAFSTVPRATYRVYFWALLLGYADEVDIRFRKACVDLVPDTVARRIANLVCGFVPGESTRERAEAILGALHWDVIGALLDGITVANLDKVPPLSNLEPVVVRVAQALRTGMQGTHDVRPGLAEVAGEAYRAAVRRFTDERIGKWGGAFLEEDPDPHVRSLGFATLVRPMPPETAVFSLFPDAPTPTGARTEPPAPPTDGPPVGAVPTLQYRPFENRGLDGALLVRLEPGPDGVSQLSDQLADVVLDVTVRAQYDHALASTVRGSRGQQRAMLETAARLLPSQTVTVPGTAPAVEAGTGELKTVHVSLRAHRDRVLQTWTTAAQLAPALVSNIASMLPSLVPLGARDPFTPLQTSSGDTVVELSFDDSPTPVLPSTEADLLVLDRRIRLSPLDLGFAADVLAGGATVVEHARLLSVGVAVIPTPDGVRPAGTLATGAEPMGLTLELPSLLDDLLPGFSVGPAPLAARLTTTMPPAAPAPEPGVRLVDIWNAATPPTVKLTVPAAVFGTPKLLYDVIFSFTYRVPALQAASSLSAVR